jgi:exodeoxyribonuclease VII large subunit
MNQQVIGVSEFVEILNETMAFAYPAVIVEGEVSSFKVNQNRWVFFDLKDDTASLSCFIPLFQLKVPLEDGMKIRATGMPKLTKWGKFSFTVKSVELAGEGELRRAFELLKTRLTADGLFDAERKRTLPRFPAVIGLVTSGQSAAYADFIKILGARWGGVRVLLADVQVQGVPAADQIIRALDYFNQMSPAPDVVTLIRGGGSLEDLQAFNTESVARAVAASRSPIIVGVGHEVDESLADFAADVRAATPTDAARLVVPDRVEITSMIEARQKSMQDSFDRHRRNAVRQLQHYIAATSRFLSQPKMRIRAAEAGLGRGLAGLSSRIKRLEVSSDASRRRILERQTGLLEREHSRVENLARVLGGFNPAATLKRGYAIVRHNNLIVRSPRQVSGGEKLMIQLSDGNLGAVTDEQRN